MRCRFFFSFPLIRLSGAFILDCVLLVESEAGDHNARLLQGFAIQHKIRNSIELPYEILDIFIRFIRMITQIDQHVFQSMTEDELFHQNIVEATVCVVMHTDGMELLVITFRSLNTDRSIGSIPVLDHQPFCFADGRVLNAVEDVHAGDDLVEVQQLDLTRSDFHVLFPTNVMTIYKQQHPVSNEPDVFVTVVDDMPPCRFALTVDDIIGFIVDVEPADVGGIGHTVIRCIQICRRDHMILSGVESSQTRIETIFLGDETFVEDINIL